MQSRDGHRQPALKFEMIAMPLLVVIWGGLIFLLDRWVLRRVDRQNGGSMA
jgi:hypothetical protein